MHKHCHHVMQYCEVCDVAYCEKCGKEWRNTPKYYWYPYQTYVSGGSYKTTAVDYSDNSDSVKAHSHP
jgi:hypothetical protein